MTTEEGFRKRAKEARAYLKSLTDIERRLSGGSTKFFYRAAKTVREIISAKFSSNLKNGCNFEDLLTDMAEFIPGSVDWHASTAKIPFIGNVDHEKVIKLTTDVGGPKLRVPKGTLGGSDIRAITIARNQLAHGEETFEVIGGACTTQDLIERLERIRIFMIAFIVSMEKYRQRRLYLAA